MSNIRIAVQSKGKLADLSLKLLANLGLDFQPNGRKCIASCRNGNVDILFLRDDDIPEYVSRGVADYGIVGENVLCEKNADVLTIKKLGFGTCKLIIAVPKKSAIKKLADLEGERIATSYPKLLRSFLNKNKINAAIIELKGSVEIAPNLNLTDAICDIVQTGKTLYENNLEPLATVLESEAVLIRTPECKKPLTLLEA